MNSRWMRNGFIYLLIAVAVIAIFFTLFSDLNGPQDCVAEIRQRYRGRRDVLVKGLGDAGWEVPVPPATMFVWAPVPEAYRPLGSLGFAKLLLREARVAVSPGVGFGEHGDGFVRFALVENRQRIRQATRNIKTFLATYDKIVGDTDKLKAAAV